MAASIIDGKAIAAEIRQKTEQEVAQFRERTGVVPGLAVILVGENPASQVYVRNKRRASEAMGIASFPFDLPAATSAQELRELIARLNADPKVHGILLQLPLPEHLDEKEFLEQIDPAKDVDGFHPVNMGALFAGQPRLVPCTPLGILELIDRTGVDLKGKRAVVVGRSNIVGKPVAMLLLQRHATVTICHSRTADLPGECRRAEVLVAAVGRRELVKGDWIRPGAVVIDVGINRTEDGKLVGDVDFESARERAGHITPVPGGVGPMTIAMLMRNTLRAARRIVEGVAAS